MIDLEKIDHLIVGHEDKGSQMKYWVQLEDERYLFKSNFKYPDYVTYSNFGEVLYSNLSKYINFPCVESYFANTDYFGGNCNGVLVKSFFEKGKQEDSMRYSDLVNIAKSHSKDFYFRNHFSNIDSCCDVVKYISKYLHKNIDIKQLRSDLFKMCVVDYFLGQCDRHLDNIEFIFDQNGNMRLAPMFDNGLCLSFVYTKDQVKKYLDLDISQKKEYEENKNKKKSFWDFFKRKKDLDEVRGFIGGESLFELSKSNLHSQNSDDRFFNTLIKEIKKDDSLGQLVNNFISLDIDKALKTLGFQNDKRLPEDYRELASRIYKNKVTKLKYEFQKRNKLKLLNIKENESSKEATKSEETDIARYKNMRTLEGIKHNKVETKTHFQSTDEGKV